jgi:pantoate--beta-alanine ligase
MGNLHDGHLELGRAATRLADRSVISIFVNPTQFGPREDFQNYPRTLEEDSRKLEQVGADLLFVPDVAELYPRGLDDLARISVPGLTQILCGRSRPGHFEGVALVVVKLLNLVLPDTALFGEKDRQQLLVIERVVADLNMPVGIVGVPTVRESDGLAMSSRNRYLSVEERAIAPSLYRTIAAAAERLRIGDRDYRGIAADAQAALESAGFRNDYFEVRRAENLAEPKQADTELLILAAAWLGRARLIDNYLVTLPGQDG